MTDESVNVTSGERDAKYRYAYEAEAERLMGTWTREQLLASFFPEFDSELIWTKEQLLAIISDTETGWLTNVETDVLERFVDGQHRYWREHWDERGGDWLVERNWLDIQA